MDKNFKEKINANRDKNFGMGKKYSPRTNKPRPTTYERTFEGEFSYNEALLTIAEEIPELKELCDNIYFGEEDYDNWFDESIYALSKYMTEISPALQTKQYIHTKFSVSVNGFSVRLENNISLDVHCKYEINNGIATILSTYVAVTTHGKVSKEGYVALTGEGSPWAKKQFVKKGNFNNRKTTLEEEKEVPEM